MTTFAVAVERGEAWADCYEVNSFDQGMSALERFNDQGRHAKLYRIAHEEPLTDAAVVATTAVKPRRLI